MGGGAGRLFLTSHAVGLPRRHVEGLVPEGGLKGGTPEARKCVVDL